MPEDSDNLWSRNRTDDADRSAPAPDVIDIPETLRAARRQAPLVLACALALGFLAAIYSVISSPVYVSRASLLLDEDRAELLNQVSLLPSAALGDSAVQSEIEILRSETLALAVVDLLDLLNDETFNDPPAQPIKTAIGWAKGAVKGVLGGILGTEDASVGDEADEADPRRDLAGQLMKRLAVDRVGRSFVLELRYGTHDPALAARIVRGYTEAYLAFQISSNADAVGAAQDWLETRIAEVRAQGLQAEEEVSRFREDRGLVLVGGQPIMETEIVGLTEQLTLARADTARVEASLLRFRALTEGDATAGIMATVIETGTPSDAIIAVLKDRYQSLSQNRAQVVARWGPDHPEVARVEEEMALAADEVVKELGRAVEGLENMYLIAREREQFLEEKLADATAKAAEDNRSLASLRQLEQIAETYGVIYSDFLQRLARAAQRYSIPVADVRVISEAETPSSAERPNNTMNTLIGLVLGGIVGAGAGVLRELGPPRARTGLDVRDALGLDFLGYAPFIASAPKGDAGQNRILQERSLSLVRYTLEQAQGARRTGRAIGVVSPVPHHSSDQFATLLASFLAADNENVLLVTSPSTDAEGRTLEPNIARELTATGGADGAIPTFSAPDSSDRLSAPDADAAVPRAASLSAVRAGDLAEAVSASAEAEASAAPESRTAPAKSARQAAKQARRARTQGFTIRSGGSKWDIAELNDLRPGGGRFGPLDSMTLAKAMGLARSKYDFVVVSLAPINTSVDARILAQHLEGLVLTVPWGEMTIDEINSVLSENKWFQKFTLGAVLTGSTFRRIRKFGQPGVFRSIEKAQS